MEKDETAKLNEKKTHGQIHLKIKKKSNRKKVKEETPKKKAEKRKKKRLDVYSISV